MSEKVEEIRRHIEYIDPDENEFIGGIHGDDIVELYGMLQHLLAEIDRLKEENTAIRGLLVRWWDLRHAQGEYDFPKDMPFEEYDKALKEALEKLTADYLKLMGPAEAVKEEE